MDRERKKYGLVINLDQVDRIFTGETGHVISVVWQDTGETENIPDWIATETLQLVEKPS